MSATVVPPRDAKGRFLPSRAPAPTAVPSTAARAVGGRLTRDSDRGLFGGVPVIVPPPSEERDWSLDDLGRDSLRLLSPAQLTARLVRLSPEFGRAAYDFLRLANPGWEAVAYRPGTEEPDERAQGAVDAFMGALADRHGAPEVPINRLLFGMWLRGAFFCELVLDKRGRAPLDLATPDPYSVRFRLVADDDYGEAWQLGQWQGAKGFVPLDGPTVRYVPFDPLPGSPYGVAPAGPGVFPAVFLLTLLADLRRVIAQQGMPHYDVSIVAEKVVAALSDNDKRDDAKRKAIMAEALGAVAEAMSDLQPDESFVHTDDSVVGTALGAVSGDLLAGVTPIADLLERMNLRGLKSMPLLFGITDGVSEANANRQWEVHAQGIKAIQHLCETPLSSLLTLALEAQGIAATVVFRFSEVRSAEELRDSQVLNQKLTNAETMERLGYETHDAAGLYATGHEPPTPEEIAASAPAPATDPEEEVEEVPESDAADVVAEPGADRGVRLVAVHPEGGAPTSPVPETVPIERADLDLAVAEWRDEMSEDWEALLDAEMIEPPDVEGGGT